MFVSSQQAFFKPYSPQILRERVHHQTHQNPATMQHSTRVQRWPHIPGPPPHYGPHAFTSRPPGFPMNMPPQTSVSQVSPTPMPFIPVPQTSYQTPIPNYQMYNQAGFHVPGTTSHAYPAAQNFQDHRIHNKAWKSDNTHHDSVRVMGQPLPREIPSTKEA